MKKSLSFGLAALWLLLIPLVNARSLQDTKLSEKPPVQTSNPTGVSDTKPGAYILGPDDSISITVLNFPDLAAKAVIPPDGTIALVLIGSVGVTGKTVQELTQELTVRWRKYIKNPSVTVSLVDRRKESVLFYGVMVKSGVLPYRDGLKLIEAVAEAGGPSPEADLTRVVLTRRTGEKRTLDLSKFETKSGTEVDIPLMGGDVIFVPEKKKYQFTVLGAVNRPGSYDYKENMRALDALALVGGVQEFADLSTATLVQDGKETRLDLEALLRRGDMTANVKLKPDDRLIIPEGNRIFIYGAVAKPGFYIYKKGDRVLDVINSVGGPSKEADLARINLIHIDKVKNTAERKEINLDKFLKKGDATGNVVIAKGDAIFVPDRRHGFQIQDVFSVLSGLSLITSVTKLFGFGGN